MLSSFRTELNFEIRTIIKGVTGIFVKQGLLNFENRPIIEGVNGTLQSQVGQSGNPHDKNPQTLIAAKWFVSQNANIYSNEH